MEETIHCECVGPGCRHKVEGQRTTILKCGWRKLKAVARDQQKWRTHLGWCPQCVDKFSVDR